MKKIFLPMVAFTFLMAGSAMAFNIYQVGKALPTETYNEVWKRWFDNEFSVLVGVDEGTAYVNFAADAGIGDINVLLPHSEQFQGDMKHIAQKALEWSKVARENNADTTQNLGCFGGYGKKDQCSAEFGITKENQMQVNFVAMDDGQKSFLQFTFIDMENSFLKTTTNLSSSHFEALDEIIDGIPAALEKTVEKAKKGDLFN